MSTLTADVIGSLLATMSKLAGVNAASQTVAYPLARTVVGASISSWQYTLAPLERKEWLFGTDLKDPFGAAFSPSRIRLALFRSYSAVPHTGVIVAGAALDTEFFAGNAGDPPGWLTLRPGGVLLLLAPDEEGYMTQSGLSAYNADMYSSQKVDFVLIGA